jgi:hypothetical protein
MCIVLINPQLYYAMPRHQRNPQLYYAMPRHQRNPQLYYAMPRHQKNPQMYYAMPRHQRNRRGRRHPDSGWTISDSQKNCKIKIIILCMRCSSSPMRLHDFYNSILNKEVPGTSQTLVPSSCTKKFCHGSKALFGLGLQIVQVSRSHSDTPFSVELLWTSNQPVAETST